MTPAPPVLCRRWHVASGGVFTIVVAATKDDARVIAAARFRPDQPQRVRCRIREATTEDIEAHSEILAAVADTEAWLARQRHSA